MHSKLTYFAILFGLILFAICALIPVTRSSSIYVVLAVPPIVGVVNGVEMIGKKQHQSGLLLIASVILLAVFVYIKWKP